MKGYKATDKNMKCRGFQFELGKWYEHEGDLVECKSGFHFCEQPSGVWAYYFANDTRVFEIEAEGVLDTPRQPGADYKRVARRIRFVREVDIDGCYNTGDYNTGDYNTGHRNTGHCNTGDYNTGHRNTGHCNTGYSNTGYYNTGDYNTGHRNTGHCNTGQYNTGHRNTGDYNTGSGNAADHAAGFFNQKPQTVRVFDTETRLTYGQFVKRYPEYLDLCSLLHEPGTIDPEPFKKIPGFTVRKLRSLHKKHLAAKQP